MINQFIGINFAYNVGDPAIALDCYELASYVSQVYRGVDFKHLPEFDGKRDRLSLKDLELATFNILGEPHKEPQHLDLAIFTPSTNGTLCTVVEDNNNLFVVYPTPKGSRIQSWKRMKGYLIGYWNTNLLLINFETNASSRSV